MILGYILKAEEFSNAMMDILLALCFEHSRTYGKLLCSNAGKIKLIWECTSKSSPLRQFVIDNFFFTVSEEHTNSQFLDFDKDCEAHSIFREFYQEVVVRGMKAHRAGMHSPQLYSYSVYIFTIAYRNIGLYQFFNQLLTLIYRREGFSCLGER